MASKPVQISIEVDLLERIDADPETRENGRSAFVRAAVRQYLRDKERAEIDQRIHASFGGKADELQSEIADLMDVQAWPSN